MNTIDNKVILKKTEGREELFDLFALVTEKILTEEKEPEISQKPSPFLQ